MPTMKYLRSYLTTSLYKLFPGTVRCAFSLSFCRRQTFSGYWFTTTWGPLLFDKRVKHSYGCWLLQISCSAVSYSCSSVENVLFGSTAFSSACFFFMHFMLENGSSHSLLAWNAFRFSVKLFVFCKSFLKFWCSIISVAIVVTNLSFSL